MPAGLYGCDLFEPINKLVIVHRPAGSSLGGKDYVEKTVLYCKLGFMYSQRDKKRKGARNARKRTSRRICSGWIGGESLS